MLAPKNQSTSIYISVNQLSILSFNIHVLLSRFKILNYFKVCLSTDYELQGSDSKAPTKQEIVIKPVHDLKLAIISFEPLIRPIKI